MSLSVQINHHRNMSCLRKTSCCSDLMLERWIYLFFGFFSCPFFPIFSVCFGPTSWQSWAVFKHLFTVFYTCQHKVNCWSTIIHPSKTGFENKAPLTYCLDREHIFLCGSVLSQSKLMCSGSTQRKDPLRVYSVKDTVCWHFFFC